jgi:nitronate monooxygenase
MTDVSGPALVKAVCSAGVVGAFPVHNARSISELDEWLDDIDGSLDRAVHAPWVPNLVVHRTNDRLDDEVECITARRAELVITSVGSPVEVIRALSSTETHVWSDVASLRHAERALEAGVDGLILLTAGAGGKSGWVNPFAFVRALRPHFDGPLVLAGGIADGTAILACVTLGCDLAYMGTRFIATEESLAGEEYRRLLVESSLDDVVLSSAMSGLPANFLRTSPGFASLGQAPDRQDFTAGRVFEGVLRRVYSCGHSVSGVSSVMKAGELICRLRTEYEGARSSGRAVEVGAAR